MSQIEPFLGDDCAQKFDALNGQGCRGACAGFLRELYGYRATWRFSNVSGINGCRIERKSQLFYSLAWASLLFFDYHDVMVWNQLRKNIKDKG